MLEARVFLVALSLVVLLWGVDVVSAQITVSISATASHPVPSTMCEFGLAIVCSGLSLTECTLRVFMQLARCSRYSIYLKFLNFNEFNYMTNNLFPGYKCMSFIILFIEPFSHFECPLACKDFLVYSSQFK